MDLDLHGFAGIRVVGATREDEAAVEDALGPLPRTLAREPDVVVRFVGELDTASLALIGTGDAGFTDDGGFHLLRGRRGARTRSLVPVADIGGRCEIVCESGGGVPLLREVVNVTALSHGAVPVHGAAFEHEGTGVLVTGWSRGGKTEALLAFMAEGARYVGDEWVYVSPDGASIHGTNEPVTLWDWNLDELPEQRALVGRADRMRMRAVRRALSHRQAPGLLGRAVGLAERRGSTRVTPERLFGAGSCLTSCAFDRLFLAAAHEAGEVTTERRDPAQVARSMTACSLYEHRALTDCYLKFRFAFPDRRNETIERLEEVYATALARAFDGKPAHVVAHPYPARIGSLHAAMSPLL